MVPTACSIFERAEADTVTPFTLNLRCTSPMPSSLMGWSGRRTNPAPNSVSGVTSAPSASWPRCRTFTTCAACLNGFVKPRFGMRRTRGIWPPSNPGRTLPPWRAVCPLPPRPAVLPIPEPGPRPLRMRARCDPGGLWRLDSVMCRSSGFAAFARRFAFGLALVFALAFGFAIAYSPAFAFAGVLDQVAHLVQHAPERRTILLHHDRLVVLQAQRFERPPLERGPADSRTDLPDPQLALAGRRQRPIAPRFALAVFPSGRQPSHGPLPGAPGMGWPRARRRAPWRRAAPS